MKKLMVKNGEYTNAQGETKGKWVQVGVILSNDKGEFVILEPSINLAGLPRSEKGGVMVSIFEDQPRNQGQHPPQQQQNSYDQTPPGY